jgi:hypothetical protein
MSKNLNSELKREENYTCDPSKRGVEGSSGVLGCEMYGERHVVCNLVPLIGSNQSHSENTTYNSLAPPTVYSKIF